MTTDDLPEPDDPAFKIDSDDSLLNTARSIHATYDHVASLFTTLLWPFFAIEEVLLFLSMPITWALGGWLPYGKHVYRNTIRAIAFLGVPLAIGALLETIVGFPAPINIYIDAGVATTTSLLTYLQTTPLALAGAITTYYLVTGLLPYKPADPQEWRTRKQPDPTYQWEHAAFPIIALSQITLLALLHEYAPTVLSVFPYGLAGLAAVIIVGSYLVHRHVRGVFTDIYQERDNEVRARLDLETLFTNANMGFFITAFAIVVIVSGVFEYLNQSSTDGLLHAHLLGMWWLSRQFRWVLYQDQDGFLNVNPRSKLWTILHRTPIAYALLVTVVGGLSLLRSAPYALELSIVPLAAILVYYPFRYYSLNGNMYAQYPRSVFDPDDWDVEQYVRDRFLTYEQAQALRPKNQLKVQLFRTRSGFDKAAQELVSADSEYFRPALPPASLVPGLNMEHGSTYDQRNEQLGAVRNSLQDFRAKLDEYEGDDKPELEEAQELNEEVGTRSIDYLNSWLF